MAHYINNPHATSVLAEDSANEATPTERADQVVKIDIIKTPRNLIIPDCTTTADLVITADGVKDFAARHSVNQHAVNEEATEVGPAHADVYEETKVDDSKSHSHPPQNPTCVPPADTCRHRT
jgi:hypothetical protein